MHIEAVALGHINRSINVVTAAGAGCADTDDQPGRQMAGGLIGLNGAFQCGWVQAFERAVRGQLDQVALADAGMKVDDLCRKHGMSPATYYKWKSKYGGLEASELKKKKELEAELARLKRMYSDLAMENDALRSLIEKKL